MIDNAVIQADLVASLKANSTLAAALVRQDGEGGAESVKEEQYAGRQFVYPAVRVRINRQIPIPDAGPCDLSRLSVSIRIITEGASSKQGNQIAGLVNTHFHGQNGGGKLLKGTGYLTYLRSGGLEGAVRTSEETWMVNAKFEGTVYPA